eukprot:3101607-Pyramimonas_sp.AAC.1
MGLQRRGSTWLMHPDSLEPCQHMNLGTTQRIIVILVLVPELSTPGTSTIGILETIASCADECARRLRVSGGRLRRPHTPLCAISTRAHNVQTPIRCGCTLAALPGRLGSSGLFPIS